MLLLLLFCPAGVDAAEAEAEDGELKEELKKDEKLNWLAGVLGVLGVAGKLSVAAVGGIIPSVKALLELLLLLGVWKELNSNPK